MLDLAIIGGGACGLTAAVVASRRGKRVALWEKEEKLGKKILVSGNGRCNLSACDVSPERYNDPAFVRPIIVEDVVGFFHGIGVATKVLQGKIYPYSESATTVVSALRAHLDCELHIGEEVSEIKKTGDYYTVNGVSARAVLFATGSNATMGTDALGLARELGVKARAFSPAVVPLRTDTAYIKGAAGLRAKCAISLVERGPGRVIRTETGEVLFKPDGVSGIASMCLSTFLAREKRDCDVVIDFLPDVKKEEDVSAYLSEAGARAFLHKTLAQCVEKQARETGVSLYDAMRSFRLEHAAPGSMKNAQVAVGGLDARQFDENLECVFLPGFYAGGEALNVDGECGGYNLHFAFACGLRVGGVC